MSSSFEKLKNHILDLSISESYQDAKSEWEVTTYEYVEDFDNCPCGQAIKELCYIRNLLNGNETYVGNVCVRQFIGIDTGNVFDGLRRIMKDPDANPNEDLIRYAYKKGFVYENELSFLMSIKRKRNLSEKQSSWRRKINYRILNKVVVRRNRG